MSADRYEQTGVPDWHGGELVGEFQLPEWVGRTGHARTACDNDLPPVAVWRVLLGFSGLPFGTRSMALWLSQYVGGKSKLAKAGRVQGSRTHCYPKAGHIARRSGASVRTVQSQLRTLEREGWLYTERHINAPSDYWIAIPDVLRCPCGCEDGYPTCDACGRVLDEWDRACEVERCTHCAYSRSRDGGADSSGRGADSSPQDADSSARAPQNLPTHLVQALGSVTEEVHERCASLAAVADAPSELEGQRPRQDRGPGQDPQLEPRQEQDPEARLAEMERRLRAAHFDESRISEFLADHRNAWAAA